MQPEANQEFHISDLLACVNREVAMRKSCYPKWDKVTSLDALSPSRKRELAMMEDLARLLTKASHGLLEGGLGAQPAPVADGELSELEAKLKALGKFTGGSLYEVKKANTGPNYRLMLTGTGYLLADTLKLVEAVAVAAAVNALPGLLTRLRAAEAPKWNSVHDRLPEEDNDYRGPIFGLWLYSEEFGVEDGFYNSSSKMWVANVPAFIGVNRVTRMGITQWRVQEAKPAAPSQGKEADGV